MPDARAPDGSAPSAPAIDLRDLHLTLKSEAGPVNILRGVELQAAPGASVGIIGPSGSGKSTLLMAVGGLERPTSGLAEVAGRDLAKLSEDDLAIFRRQHVGIVFQSFHLITTMTALENVATPLELAGAPDAFERAGAELEAVGLGHRAGHYPGQMSGGEQQRVALARALAPRPDILLADEPTGNLDAETGAEIADLMFAMNRERGATLMLVTHDPALARRCERVYAMRDGRLVDVGDAGQAAAG